jgi:hypothetical protein
MRLLLAALCGSALVLAAQDKPADQRKHLSVPTPTSATPIRIAASEIERGATYPSVIHLKGDVEIRTPVCVTTGPGTQTACAGYIVMRADEADFHEDSGEVEARGTVRVTREK